MFLTWKNENRKLVINIGKASAVSVSTHLGARLADLGLLEPHLRAGVPPEDGEGPRADLALLAEPLLDHPEVGVVAQARLAEDGELGVLPVLTVVGVRVLRGRHGDLGENERTSMQRSRILNRQ